jgi:cAMP-dependent protein kinase regulator
MELEFLREQVQKLSQIGGASNDNSTADEAHANDHSESEHSSADSDGDEDVFDLPIEEVKRQAAKRGPRASVSAEAFGNWNKKEEFKAPFYEKSEVLTNALRERLS